jgi:hypothetical protein
MHEQIVLPDRIPHLKNNTAAATGNDELLQINVAT